MNLDVGLWDRLFGEKTVLNVPGPNGGQQVKVSVKWLEKMHHRADSRSFPGDKRRPIRADKAFQSFKTANAPTR